MICLPQLRDNKGMNTLLLERHATVLATIVSDRLRIFSINLASRCPHWALMENQSRLLGLLKKFKCSEEIKANNVSLEAYFGQVRTAISRNCLGVKQW